LACCRRLEAQDQASLLAFAEFLASRQTEQKAPEERPSEAPIEIERPADESVIAAIKRLSASYPMLDRSRMLNETSTLMSGHLLQGRPASAVIDDLEALFQQHYSDYRGD
jgi:hypothetical protein